MNHLFTAGKDGRTLCHSEDVCDYCRARTAAIPARTTNTPFARYTLRRENKKSPTGRRRR